MVRSTLRTQPAIRQHPALWPVLRRKGAHSAVFDIAKRDDAFCVSAARWEILARLLRPALIRYHFHIGMQMRMVRGVAMPSQEAGVAHAMEREARFLLAAQG